MQISFHLSWGQICNYRQENLFSLLGWQPHGSDLSQLFWYSLDLLHSSKPGLRLQLCDATSGYLDATSSATVSYHFSPGFLPRCHRATT